MRLFKGILSGALNAYSDKFLAQEIEFLINAFAGNEYNYFCIKKGNIYIQLRMMK